MPKAVTTGIRKRNTTLPRDWGKRSKTVIARANGRCENDGPRCTIVATEAHHKMPREQGGSHSYDNLMAVCHTCHVELGNEPVTPCPWV